jgi:hypothetical protein
VHELLDAIGDRRRGGEHGVEQVRMIRHRDVVDTQALDRRVEPEGLLRTARFPAPKPAVRVSSCTMRQRPVLRTDPGHAPVPGAMERRSISSTEASIIASASTHRCTIAPS